MYNRILSVCLALACVGLAATAEIPISNGEGATIDDLILEKTLVTILLNGNVRDTNLQLTKLNKTTITFIKPDGKSSAYLLSMVKAIRVQGERLDQKKSIFSKGTLSHEEQRVVDRARERIIELSEGVSDPTVKMRAACLGAIMGMESGTFYLQNYAHSNDTPLAVLANLYLYLAGHEIDKDVLTEGFLHGNRDTRRQSAVLAGLHGGDEFIKELRYMAKDPHPEVNPAAARALARLGDRWVLPVLYDGIGALKHPKNEAAIYGLTVLGDDAVIATLKKRLPLANKSEWFRIVRILYALEDEDAATLMREKALSTYAYEETAGLLLGETNDWDGGVWIREYLEKAKDPDYKNLMFRANLAAALYGTAQSQAKIVFQEMMRMNETQVFAKGNTSNAQYKEVILAEVKEELCRLLGEQGDKTMLSLLLSPMESQNASLALTACEAIIMIANNPYRERYRDFNVYTGYREMLLPGFFN